MFFICKFSLLHYLLSEVILVEKCYQLGENVLVLIHANQTAMSIH